MIRHQDHLGNDDPPVARPGQLRLGARIDMWVGTLVFWAGDAGSARHLR